MDREICKKYKLKGVPSFIVADAIEWHNNVTGDTWDISMESESDIQYRIAEIVSKCDEYKIVSGRVVKS